MNKYKYPRTPHLPFSQGFTSDDKVLASDEHFEYMDKVVVTIKMDGENTTIYSDGSFHARSLDSIHRSYHSWLLKYIQEWYWKIPNSSYRICGEYLYAKHSIKYTDLKSYFLAFSIWENELCFDWPTTKNILANIPEIQTVPVIYEGPYDRNKIKELAEQVIADGQEGIVVRNRDNYFLNTFDENVAKYVRKNHVQTEDHWMFSEIERNELK